MVVNDAPDDPCPADLAGLLRARGVSIENCPVNLGRSAARNLGAARAATPWIEHVDGDDRPLPFPIDSLARAAGSEAGLISYPELEYTEPGPTPAMTNPWPRWEPGVHTYWAFLFPQYGPVNPHPAGTVWARDAYLALGGYDARLANGEDMQLLWKASRAGVRCLHWPAPKQAYLIHAATSVRGRSHTYAHHATLLLLRAEASGEIARKLDLLIGRQLLYNAEFSLGELWRRRATVWSYLRAKLDRSFGRFNQ